MKSTVEQIRQRFDADVERFSNAETGQTATVDAALTLELVVAAAAATNQNAQHMLDLGCGAGNFTLRLLEKVPNLHVTLIDLSKPMLARAVERVQPATSGEITVIQGDIREIELGEELFDVILAAAVLHHLRGDDEWQAVFAKLHAALKVGGSLWISDLIDHETSQIQALMRERYGAYLTQLKDESYRDHVFAYIQQEDTPRSLMFQIDLLRAVGFSSVEILHKNNTFAAFGAIKSGTTS